MAFVYGFIIGLVVTVLVLAFSTKVHSLVLDNPVFSWFRKLGKSSGNE